MLEKYTERAMAALVERLDEEAADLPTAEAARRRMRDLAPVAALLRAHGQDWPAIARQLSDPRVLLDAGTVQAATEHLMMQLQTNEARNPEPRTGEAEGHQPPPQT